MIVRVHADLAEFTVPFLSPGRSVGDEMFNSIADYAPVPAVHLPKPVTSLTDGEFWDTMDARGKFESVVVPVGGLSPAAPGTVSVDETAYATSFRGDVPNWGHFELSGWAANGQPFVPLSFWGIRVLRDSVTTEPGDGSSSSSLQFPIQKVPCRSCFQDAL